MPATSAAPAHLPRRIDASVLLPATLALIALIAIGWAVSMRADLDSAQDRVRELEAEVDQLRTSANATAYTLSPSGDAPSNASGTAFFSLDGAGVISIANLTAAPAGRSYQVWFYPSAESEPIPGETFAVDDTGAAYLLIPADVGQFTMLTVTLEPEAGVTAPTGPIVLSGETGGARG